MELHIAQCTSPSNLNGLAVKQKAAVRIINGENYNAHTAPLFKKSAVLPLPMLVEFFKLQFMHNFLNKNLPKSFETMWLRNEERRQEDHRILRSHTELFIPPSRLTSTEKFPLFSFPHIWCTFPDAELKNILNKNLFNSKLKTHFLSSLPSIYVCNRLFCHACRLQT